ncbi:MAG: NADH-quinone oxidoreductase subunit H [Candidatus Kaiserbacteria bacterium]|nr:MAG: NADH-quinone oxidoreductase subunit H [Candidatus Kaiserbacteria bacterium]
MTILLPTLLILLASPLTVGLVRKFKALFQNRRGASIFQPYWALLSLLRKDMTITRYSSWVFHTVPFVVLGSTIALAALVPAVPIAGTYGNVFLIAGVLALGSVFLVLGGMDTASTFGNMGSSREMSLIALVEPPLFIVFASLALFAGSFGMGDIIAHFTSATAGSHVLTAVTLIALFFVVLAENARYPVDNPATHLELTMVHEAMMLEYSGPYLALLEYASAIKLTVLGTLFVSLLLPSFAASGTVLALLFLGKLILAAFLVAFVESTIVKMRFYRMQEYMALAFLFALGGAALIILSKLSGAV